MELMKLKEILEKHEKWLNHEEGGERADLCDAILTSINLSHANLEGAILSGADLSRANLYGVNLCSADLSYTILIDANLSHANLYGVNLSHANLSDVTRLLNLIDYLAEKFERTEDGHVAYKVFNGCYASPAKWKVELGEIITEEVNSCRTDKCGCGINVAPLEWVKRNFLRKDIYKLLIKWEWLAGVVVPYNTSGQIRCSRAQIIGKV